MASTAFGLLSPQTPVRARTLSQLQAPIPSIDIKCVLPLSPIGLVAGNEHCFKAQTHAEPAFGQCDHSTNRSRDKPQDSTGIAALSFKATSCTAKMPSTLSSNTAVNCPRSLKNKTSGLLQVSADVVSEPTTPILRDLYITSTPTVTPVSTTVSAPIFTSLSTFHQPWQSLDFHSTMLVESRDRTKSLNFSLTSGAAPSLDTMSDADLGTLSDPCEYSHDTIPTGSGPTKTVDSNYTHSVDTLKKTSSSFFQTVDTLVYDYLPNGSTTNHPFRDTHLHSTKSFWPKERVAALSPQLTDLSSDATICSRCCGQSSCKCSALSPIKSVTSTTTSHDVDHGCDSFYTSPIVQVKSLITSISPSAAPLVASANLPMVVVMDAEKTGTARVWRTHSLPSQHCSTISNSTCMVKPTTVALQPYLSFPPICELPKATSMSYLDSATSTFKPSNDCRRRFPKSKLTRSSVFRGSSTAGHLVAIPSSPSLVSAVACPSTMTKLTILSNLCSQVLASHPLSPTTNPCSSLTLVAQYGAPPNPYLALSKANPTFTRSSPNASGVKRANPFDQFFVPKRSCKVNSLRPSFSEPCIIQSNTASFPVSSSSFLASSITPDSSRASIAYNTCHAGTSQVLENKSCQDLN
ncbi:hypothetical protein BATDEDRAFT_34597 [Batrachochytrium dendrobatidis JAM81]|uniref:Uncharacterized protein n=2 Tax=Batrachochytrium dendrobatidis TaxID=109871 RepID=F4NZ47_BATDJ|nr:uncharacterized protein BATDEDRAFT_34597 [Batrachochytrium dendrobatidis JAM81]EGF82139.1 hypothetical protein BATDEDRAFT_34597 [Batrachochytrium dendrobatidis JAM81]|eukprot:XP_006677420.1 hypothetical protein BATDEDRAFT_34597 [Batrachochytrium dendrobatidis JAM81]